MDSNFFALNYNLNCNPRMRIPIFCNIFDAIHPSFDAIPDHNLQLKIPKIMLYPHGIHIILLRYTFVIAGTITTWITIKRCYICK